MKTIVKVLVIILCGIIPIGILFMILHYNLERFNDKGFYTISTLIIAYFAWYSTIGYDKVKSWFV